MCGQELFNLPADLTVMDGGGQLVRLSRSPRIGIESGGDYKLLPKDVFLREDAVMGEYFKVLNLNYIHSVSPVYPVIYNVIPCICYADKCCGACPRIASVIRIAR